MMMMKDHSVPKAIQCTPSMSVTIFLANASMVRLQKLNPFLFDNATYSSIDFNSHSNFYNQFERLP